MATTKTKAKPTTTPKQRVQAERDALAEKIESLTAFLNAPEHPEDVTGNDIALMTTQLDTMRRYILILDLRLKKL